MSLGDALERHRAAILGVTGMLAAAGLWAGLTLPVSIFPAIGFHRIAIIARAGNLPVEQTVTTLTEPLESALGGVSGLQQIRSKTTRGGTEIDLRFDWGQDMARALQLVGAATQEARAALPKETEIETRELDSSAFPIIGVAVTSERRSLASISEFVRYEAVPRIRSVPGVFRVELGGEKTRELIVEVDPEAVRSEHLRLEQIETALRASNAVTAAGRIRSGYRLALVSVSGSGAAADSLLDTTISNDRGASVPLRAVAHLESAVREDFTRGSANGFPAVLIGVSRQATGNALDVSRGVRERTAELAREHPELHFDVYYDQADLVADAVSSVREAILVGLVLAVATVFLFIADARATMVAAAVIPVTVLITCLVLHLLDMSLDLMTLGGIAAGIGLVLDDAIVVVENLHRHRDRGESAHEAIARSTSEIAPALVGSTLTPVAVLLPLTLLGEVPGAFFRPLAITMSVALVTSLLLALSFTPALIATLSGDAAPSAVRHGPGDRLAEWAARGYARAVAWLLRRHAVAALLGAAAIAVAFTAYRHLETGFVPQMDEGAFVLDYWAPPGSSIEETLHLLETVDGALHEVPEVASFSRRTGSELGFFLTESNRGDYAVRLRTGSRRPIEEVIADVRGRLAERTPTLRVEFVQILQDMLGDLSGEPAPIEVKLFGRDSAALAEAARQVTKVVREVDGAVDVFDGVEPLGPTVQVSVDDAAAARVGLDAASVTHVLETAIPGTVVGEVLDRDRAIPLRLQYPPTLRDHVETIGDLALVTTSGSAVPLRTLAKITDGTPATTHERENLRRLMRVTAHLEDRDLGSAVDEIRTKLAHDVKLPAGVGLELGGLYASQRRAFGELATVLAAAGGSVGTLLLVEFGSVAAALAIVLGSSLALSGSLLALWITHTPLNVSSIVGMIMVIGIVAKNGILLLDFADRERRGGISHEDALVAAGSVRLRPILMTQVAAVAGLLPLAFGLGAGGQMQQPLTIAIVGGVALSMPFSLLGVPLLDAAFARLRRPRPPFPS